MMKLPWVKTPKRRILGGEAFNDENAPSSPERATDADGGKRETHYGRSIPAWSPGLRGRSARNREVLLVARNAREQARENEFLRLRVRELEREIGEHHERDAADASASRRDAAARESQSRSETAALKAEAAAHAASAAQLEEELERMRAIEDQSAEEAMRLIQKISSLQTDLAAATRRATIAEEMLAGTKSEGERAVEDAERWRLEAARVEAEKSKQTELEKSYADATEELKSLREENALMRADISALHSGMEAQLRAEEDCFADADEKYDSNDDADAFGTPAAEGIDTPREKESREKDARARGGDAGGAASKPAPGDGVIFLRGRAVRVEGATTPRERPPPPHRSRWASPMRSSFSKKIAREAGDATPFRNNSDPCLRAEKPAAA